MNEPYWGVGLDDWVSYVDKAPASVLSIVWGLRKQFKIGSQIRHLTLPPSVCQPRSLLMKLADNFTRGYLLIGVNQEPSPELRYLQVLKVILSGFSLGPPPEALRHVFNPVVGEHFECTFPNQDGSITSFLSEQISHHPPVSAFVGTNDKHRFVVEATVRPQYVNFQGNQCISKVDGALLVHLQELNETYIASHPSFGVTNLLMGKTRIGYTGTMTLQCAQTGMKGNLEIHLHKKKKDSTITGEILNQQGTPVYSLSGNWTKDIFITDLKTGVKSVFFSSQYPITKPIMKSPQELDEFSSERIWKEVVEGIKKGNEEDALAAKLKIEQNQRDGEAKRAEGTPYQPRFFHLDNTVEEEFYRFNPPTSTPDTTPAITPTPTDIAAATTATKLPVQNFGAASSLSTVDSPTNRR